MGDCFFVLCLEVSLKHTWIFFWQNVLLLLFNIHVKCLFFFLYIFHTKLRWYCLTIWFFYTLYFPSLNSVSLNVIPENGSSTLKKLRTPEKSKKILWKLFPEWFGRWTSEPICFCKYIMINLQTLQKMLKDWFLGGLIHPD